MLINIILFLHLVLVAHHFGDILIMVKITKLKE